MRSNFGLPVASPDPARRTAQIEFEPQDRNQLNEALLGVAAGDRNAFASFYDGAASMVFGLAKRIARSTSIAEDVTQEVFLEVWRKAGDWSPARSSAIAWTLMITRRRAIDRVRSEQAARDRHHIYGPGLTSDPGVEPSDAIELVEDHDTVRSVLDVLTDKQRTVIDLAYYEGKTYVEVAAMLDLPIGTVKTRMRDALLKMRDSFGVTS